MTGAFGRARSEDLVLCVLESALCFAAAYLLLEGSERGDAFSTLRSVLLAAALALGTGVAAGLAGMNNPLTWTRGRRLAGGGLLTVVMLLPLNSAAVALSGLGGAQPGLQAGSTVLLLVVAGVGIVVITRLSLLLLGRAQLLRLPAASEQPAGVAILLAVPDDAAPPLPAWAERRAALAALRAQQLRVVLATGKASTGGTGLPPRWDRQSVPESAELLEQREGRVDVAALPPDWLLTARGTQNRPIEAGLRRGFDILISLALLAFTLPLVLLAALAIRLDSPGPVFYRQDRVGLNGRVFSLLKLRSMRADAEAGGAPQWALTKDDRVTRVGRILRLIRIDEIPQVLNVLRGDMAFIGPRPERPAFVAMLGHTIPHYHDRAVVKPGITGWAQVNFPYGASVEDARQKLSYDLYYVRRRSPFLDLLILLATVRVVLLQEGSR